MIGRRQMHERLLRLTAMTVIIAILAACDTGVDIPDVVREPEIIGEVLTREPVADQGPRERRYVFELSTGETVDVDLNTALRVGGGPAPDAGFLLLYGTQPDGPWFWSGPLLDDPVTGRQGAGIAGPALDDGSAIVFEIGLRLPKATDFDPAEQQDGIYSNPAREFCVDEHGQVTRFGL